VTSRNFQTDVNGRIVNTFYMHELRSELVSWSLTSLFSTNMAISETKLRSDESSLLFIWYSGYIFTDAVDKFVIV